MCKGTFDEGTAPTSNVISRILRCLRPADPRAYQQRIDPYHDGKANLKPADQATQSHKKMCKETECSIAIDENWEKTFESSLGTSDGSTAPTASAIFRVPEYMRAAKPMTYQPRIVAIDPYHDGKPHLQPVDQATQSHKKMHKEMECSIFTDENWVKTFESSLGTSDGSTTPTPSAIFRIPEYMRAAEPMTYEPRIVAIGPYHHGKPDLQAAERLKKHSVKLWLRRGTGRTPRDYLIQIKELESRARAAYADPPYMNSNAFAEMLLLDACFVLEVICLWALGQQLFEGLQNTFTSNRGWLTAVARDMLLLENQLPFFLLEALFDSFFPPGVAEAGKLHDWALLFFSNFSGGRTAFVGSDGGNIANCKHILHLLHSRITSTRQTNHAKSSTTAGSARRDLPRVNNPNYISSMIQDEEPEHLNLRWIPSATEMKAAGVQLRRKKQARSFLDVTFDNGKMEIPQLEVDCDTIVFLTNVIVFEQCYYPYVDTDVMAYAFLLTRVIDTAEDAALLKRLGIIPTGLGNNEQVAHRFSNLRKVATIDYENCYLSQVFHDVKKHCNRKQNHWRADFWHECLSTPRSIIALSAAIVIFMCTIVQLILGFLNFRRHH